MTATLQTLGTPGEYSIAQLEAMPAAEFQQLDLSLAELQRWVKDAQERMQAAKVRRFGTLEQQARLRESKPNGVIHFDAGDFQVTADAPKRVSWDQTKLADLARRITANGEKLEDYIDIEYTVPEARFNAWPESWRAQFMPARTVKIGKPTYRLALLKEVL
ncbi:hypothetical protein [Chitinibacter sp. GC72]|uniref:hypothetical protein n=1 Tax=Chitinibacter sp. GC72 TaxID=1526917 RepID=UPI0012FA8A12|nr:hypothetical protein [Chitinibacter sp. GC72]